jgi:hypothetical protein
MGLMNPLREHLPSRLGRYTIFPAWSFHPAFAWLFILYGEKALNGRYGFRS